MGYYGGPRGPPGPRQMIQPASPPPGAHTALQAGIPPGAKRVTEQRPGAQGGRTPWVLRPANMRALLQSAARAYSFN
jgi:hypothetical protein